MEANEAKVYVDVLVDFLDNGQMLPRRVTWEDGRKFDIDRVSDIRPAYAAKAGGQGDRYTVYINGRKSYIFFERGASVKDPLGRWFVERR